MQRFVPFNVFLILAHLTLSQLSILHKSNFVGEFLAKQQSLAVVMSVYCNLSLPVMQVYCDKTAETRITCFSVKISRISQLIRQNSSGVSWITGSYCSN